MLLVAGRTEPLNPGRQGHPESTRVPLVLAGHEAAELVSKNKKRLDGKKRPRFGEQKRDRLTKTRSIYKRSIFLKPGEANARGQGRTIGAVGSTREGCSENRSCKCKRRTFNTAPWKYNNTKHASVQELIRKGGHDSMDRRGGWFSKWPSVGDLTYALITWSKTLQHYRWSIPPTFQQWKEW